jgi:ABC-2 type transport system permease protein
MRELVTIFSPQWWTFKNRLLRSGRTAYIKALFMLILGGGFWAAALHYLTIILTRLQGMEGGIGIVIALKGLSLLLMLVFFLLIFSSMLSGINNFYLSSDLPIVLSSPVSWENIYLSKWLETSVKSSWMILFAVLPGFIALGLVLKTPVTYYIILLPVLTIFVMVPVGIGIMISIILMALVPAKRARNIFVFLGLLIVALLFLLFRFLKPERFANPEWFANLTIFLSEMKLPVSVFLPSMWATESLVPFFRTGGGEPFFYLSLLLFTSGAFIVIGNWLFRAFFYSGMIKAQHSRSSLAGTYKEGAGGLGLSFCLFFAKGYRKALFEKDIVTFFRNVRQSSQLLLLFAIIIIYLFSIKSLPLEWGTYLSLQLKYVISFLNIGLVAFVITAVAARIVLPSVENEGRAFWIIRVSPVSMRGFLWSKFMMAFFPLLLLSQMLIVISNILLGVKIWFMLLSTGTCLVLVASITALAIGIGAYNARFSPAETDREQTGFQGTSFMLLAFAVILMTIMLEIIPTLSMFMKEVSESLLTFTGWAIIGTLLSAVFILNSLVIWVAMRMGEKKLTAME